jgi:hypothetical protein
MELRKSGMEKEDLTAKKGSSGKGIFAGRSDGGSPFFLISRVPDFFKV